MKIIIAIIIKLIQMSRFCLSHFLKCAASCRYKNKIRSRLCFLLHFKYNYIIRSNIEEKSNTSSYSLTLIKDYLDLLNKSTMSTSLSINR